jgi:hypothetical protein
MNEKVYPVFLCTGDYNCVKRWLLKVFRTPESAEKFASNVRKELDDLGVHTDGNNTYYDSDFTLHSRYEDYMRKYNDIVIEWTGAWVDVNNPVDIES